LATSGPGLLERTARLVKPDISIVTLVALEHYPACTLEEVAKEKPPSHPKSNPAI
jgi:UDP-N-acetylmuramyl pentapeptide synthase